MSCEKGNIKRTRAQKYKNSHVFKNNLHDTSHTTKHINSIQVCNVCERCKKIIEWKIKYKKYKPLKSPATCTKCSEKTIKRAYHTICGPCARKFDVCPKCGVKGEIIESKPNEEEQVKLDAEMQVLLKKLPERKRRTFLRYMNKGTNGEKTKSNKKSEFETVRIPDILKERQPGDSSSDEYENTLIEVKEIRNTRGYTKEDLMAKLKSMAISKDSDDEEDVESDDYDGGDDDFDNQSNSSLNESD